MAITPEYTKIAASQRMLDRINVTGVIDAADGSKLTVGVGGSGSVQVVETDTNGNNFILYSGDGDDGEGWKTKRNIKDASKMLSDLQAVATSEGEVAVDETKNVAGGGGNFRKLENASTTTNTGVTIEGYGRNQSQTNAVANAAIKVNQVNKAANEEIIIDEGGNLNEESSKDLLVDEIPIDEIPVDEVPVDEIPVDEVPVDEVPVDEVPVDEVIVDDVEVIPAGQNVAVQAVPQTVTQAVTPPSYYNQPNITTPAEASISNKRAGTFSKPLQTSGLSAVPEQVTYKTHYAGTPGLVDSSLTAPVGGGTGPQQVVYRSKLGGQEIIVTEINGQPVTYVPPNFERIGTYAEIAQQQQKIAGDFKILPEKGLVDQGALTMAQGGEVRGYASGGDVALIKLAQMNGFKGNDPATARSFMNASEGLRNKVTAMGALMNRGGLAMAQGGTVPNNTMIAGQPHRLAYVNPQEEAMMKSAGGTGAPSHGGIPAYFSVNPIASSTEATGETAETIKEIPFDQLPFTGQQDLRSRNLLEQTMNPLQAPVAYTQPVAADFVPVDAGQATPIAPFAEAAKVGTVQQAELPTASPTFASFTPDGVATDVAAETAKLTGATGTVSDAAQATAQQQLTSGVTGMTAAQDTAATMVDAPAPRSPLTGEIINPVANAQSAKDFTEQVQAATATPSAKATVQGQLEGLMQQFEGGNTPAWAAGSMRNATAMLAARGLAASSMAGQAVIQATMEAALPIAQLDAQVNAQFEGQNLSNRQARAMLSAQQRAQFLGMEFDQAFQSRVANSARIGDIANMNFTAEQNIAMENSRATNTMKLNNLSNRQAMVMAEAAALSNLDMSNLNNRQQAEVQNAQNFMQMDMTNLSNDQQVAMFKSQQNVQALFTDQAAENASKQFNASSENQTNQFFENLRGQTSQFNASQQNAMDQFNVNSVNALREFNSEIQQQRDLFNAQNGLLIAQSNAQWRQTVSTTNSAAQNESNMEFAKQMSGLTARNLDAYWQTERDGMSFVYQMNNNNADRATSLALQYLKNEAELSAQASNSSSIFSKILGVVVDKIDII